MKINNVNSVQSTTFKAKLSPIDIQDAKAFIKLTARTQTERDSANLILDDALKAFAEIGDKNTKLKYFPPRHKDQIGYYRMSNDMFSAVSVPLGGLPTDKYYRGDIYLFNGPERILDDLDMIMENNLIQKAEKQLLEKASFLRHIYPKTLLKDLRHQMTDNQHQYWRHIADELSRPAKQSEKASPRESFDDYFKREYAKMSKK